MSDIKKYFIKFGEVPGDDDKYLKSEIKKVLNIEFLDNLEKTVIELKIFICELFNYKFCPCKLKIYNDTSFYYYSFSKEKYLDCNDNDKLSSLNLKDSFYVIKVADIKCNCSEYFKLYFKSSKPSIINILNEIQKQCLENEKIINNLKLCENKSLEIEIELEIKNEKIQDISKENQKLNMNLDQINADKNELEKNCKLKEEELNNLTDINKKLKDDNSNLINENNSLRLALEENPDTIRRMHDMGYLQNITISQNSTQIDRETNKLKTLPNQITKEELKNFYDVIIHVTSIKHISKGWKIEMTEKGKKNFNDYKVKPLLKIGVIGNSNKGKSFILSRISKIKLASGYFINTKGLSIKYPELKGYENRNIALIDSAGLEAPVLKDNIQNEDIEENKKDNEGEEKNGNNENKELKDNDLKANDSNNNKSIKTPKKDEDKMKNIFMEKSKEKLITELFLQKYIILNSDILLLVVGILTYSEQKLINKILNEIKNSEAKKKIFIIHNLKELFSKEQVENYIKENLLNSVTFDLIERVDINTKYTQKNESKYGRYFVEKNDENDKNSLDIFHLIFANEDSEAGKYYNRYALEFIENSYKSVAQIGPFDVIKTIKERFKEDSKDFIENNNDIIQMNDDEDIIKNKIIKLKNQEEIILKRCLIDEFGLWNLKRNGFEPKYNYYKRDKKVIVKIEVPGICSIESQIKKKGELTIIRINGEKEKDETEEKEQLVEEGFSINKRDFGEFNFEIILKAGEDWEIKNQDTDIHEEHGIIILEFECEDKVKKKVFRIGKK